MPWLVNFPYTRMLKVDFEVCSLDHYIYIYQVGIKKLFTKTMALKSFHINGYYSNLACLIVTYFGVLYVKIVKIYQFVWPLQPCLCRFSSSSYIIKCETQSFRIWQYLNQHYFMSNQYFQYLYVHLCKKLWLLAKQSWFYPSSFVTQLDSHFNGSQVTVTNLT